MPSVSEEVFIAIGIRGYGLSAQALYDFSINCNPVHKPGTKFMNHSGSGGRGKKRRYKTFRPRIPEPLRETVTNMVDAYHSEGEPLLKRINDAIEDKTWEEKSAPRGAPHMAPSSARIYGRVVAKRRRELGLTQRELWKLIHVSEATLYAIEQGRRLPSWETMMMLAQVLKLPQLACVPSSIEWMEGCQKERILHEEQGVEAFVAARDNRSRERIARMERIYLKAAEERDGKTKSRMDKILHEQFISFCPDQEMRCAVDCYQKMLIEFFQCWVPRLGYGELLHRAENIRNHKHLFEASIEGSPRDIEEMLKLHLNSSLKDLSSLRQCLSNE